MPVRFRDQGPPSGFRGWPCHSSPRFSTAITLVDSGDEHGNQRWQHPLFRYQLPEAVRDQATFEAIYSHWMVMAGPFHTWPFRDPLDFASAPLALPNTVPVLSRTDVQIGVADGIGNTFPIVKTKVVFNDTTGSIVVKVDGVTVLSVSGIDTVATGNVECTQVVFGTSNTNQAGTWYMDDLHVFDGLGSVNNDFIGDKRVLLQLPDADTAVTDWVRNGGATDYERINELSQDGDTTYIEATAAADVSEFSLQDLPAAVSGIAGVQLGGMMRKTDAGTCNLQMSLVSSGSPPSVGAGTDQPITEVYTYWDDVIEVDPATGAAWARAGRGPPSMRRC